MLEAKQRSDEALPLLGLSGEGDIGVAQLRTVPMSERPFKEQIASLDYWVFVGYIAVSVLWLNMYIGTMPIQLERITSDRATGTLSPSITARKNARTHAPNTHTHHRTRLMCTPALLTTRWCIAQWTSTWRCFHGSCLRSLSWARSSVGA